MPSCVVKWCRSHTDMKNSGITFHKFPRNETQRNKWVNAVRLERNEPDWLASKCSAICSLHFKTEDLNKCSINGKYNRLKKTAVPICTMVSSVYLNADVYSNSSEPYFIKCEKNIQVEKSHEVGIEVNRKDADANNILIKCELEVPGDRNLKEIKCEVQENSNEVKIEVDLGDPHANIIKRELEESGCSYMEERTCETEHSPNVVKLYVRTDIFENEAKLPSSEEPKPSCSTPISIPLSDMEEKLKKQLDLKTALAKKRLLKIKNLQRQNIRLKHKTMKLKEIIRNLKKNGYHDSKLHTALSGFTRDMFCALQKKEKRNGRSIIKLTPGIKKFALTLNYYSASAYEYIRNELLSCLPHPSTIAKWYQSIDGKPGYKKEAFRALQAKYSQNDKKLVQKITAP